MRALMLDVPHALLDRRHRLGQDRWDEVWDGVLHMVPPPHGDHGLINDGFAEFFRVHWQARGLGRTLPETGVRRPDAPPHPELGGDVPSDYRTPDRSFLLAENLDRFQGGWIVGPPDAVLEIVSPGDESRTKLPWYHALGVREVLLVDRRTRAVEVWRSGSHGLAPVEPDADGWIRSAVLATELRREQEGGGGALHLRCVDEPERSLVVRLA